jgi:hypothetical protein
MTEQLNNNKIDYSQHFCKGDDIWKSICFECQYPTEKERQTYFLEEIKRLKINITELNKKRRFTIIEKTNLKVYNEEEKYKKELKKLLKWYVLNNSRQENKILEILNLFKNRPYLKNKIEKILYSSNNKYSYPNNISKISVLKEENKDE